MQTQSSSSCTALLILGAVAALSMLGCAVGGGGGTLAAGDALHADLATCPVDATAGAACDPSLTDCATSTDFSVACRCEAGSDGTTRVRCEEPLPVPALRICSDDIAPGVRCDGSSRDDGCVLPRGGRCVCREHTDDPRVPAGGIFEWACEVPPPGPTACDSTTAIVAGDDCTGLEGTTCAIDSSTSCICSSTGARDGSRWICIAEPTVIPACGAVTGGCAAFPQCSLDDGRLCRCVEDGSGGVGRYECGPPPPPPVFYCPAGVGPDSTSRVECREIGASCSPVAGSSTSSSCRCVEDSMRDPAFPVGVWECGASSTGTPSSV